MENAKSFIIFTFSCKRINGQSPRGGGGGTQMWFRRGCTAEAAKPVPIFKGHFWRKRVPIIKGFLVKKNGVFVYFSDEKGENGLVCTAKLQKWGACLRFSSSKPYPMFKDFSQKSDLLERHTPVCLTQCVPPPPPPPGANQFQLLF